jgi:glycerol-3-phosphate dehydrogenase
MSYGIEITKNINSKPRNLVEGLNAIEATMNLSKIFNLELPIIFAISRFINKEANIDETIRELFSRPIKNEFE